ncbi:large conductance mechanosensitive channel protein MscL [Ethanoligenens harbinense]|nr:large conductance mechanosensitive channel protein MscL [Ethanoligenens harbinense YUAN-3]AYF40116.1 large conductance mechanosensitive channel protein MscL [Ethanoligenens harbinense]AYF42956.1 large conductance mechanosensitive channel protein MscL [Ethanoligenens harbinense]QCN93714.1 large conductance mechanosensitive channel protein MscL [Ethanoligenens harbinense]
MKGNAFDLAIGVIIGAAFSSIVTALVKDIMTPLIGIFTGHIDVSKLTYTINGIPGTKSIILPYGDFLQAIINFIIIAFCIFLMVKAVSKLHQKEEKKEEAAAPAPDLVVLQEIRDLLKEQRSGAEE